MLHRLKSGKTASDEFQRIHGPLFRADCIKCIDRSAVSLFFGQAIAMTASFVSIQNFIALTAGQILFDRKHLQPGQESLLCSSIKTAMNNLKPITYLANAH